MVSRRSFLGAAGFAVAAASLPWGSAFAAPDAGFSFVHPGILHRREDLDRMRAAVAARQSPIYNGFQAMAAHPRSSYAYVVQNTGQITSWGRGPANFQNQAVADSAAAYQTALMWAITGDVRYADKTRDILNAWSASLTAITGADGQLGTGLQGFKFANAAEILRHTDYGGWPDEDFQRCADSLRKVWYESLSGYALFANGNWDDAAVQTVIAVAVLCDDRVMFENALRYAAYGAGNGSILNRVINGTGQGQESGRDQAHEQLGQALLANVAQVAWNQGVDLFGFADNRILAGYEYDARYNLGFNDLPFVTDLDRTGKYLKTALSDKQRGQFQPCYELAYAHYVSHLGLSAPNTAGVIFRGPGGTRVVEGSNDDEPSWGTLTYARPATGPSSPSAPPGSPGGLRARGDADQVTVSWVDSVEPVSGAKATAYTVKRATVSGGPYLTLATGLTASSYPDRAVRPGCSYFYVVSASNAAGTSADSTEVAGTAGLPVPWSARDIGYTSAASGTTFDGERFVVEAGGSDIAGTSDGFRFTYVPLPADGVITARIVFPVSSQYAKVGVMMRGSLDADAPHASMLIQGLPLHAWSGVWTTRAVGGGATSGTGSTPVPPSQQEAITTRAAFPLSDLGSLPTSATPLPAPYIEAAGDGYRFRMPYWVRLSRKQNRFAGEISPDGREWTEVGSGELPLNGPLYVGLAHTPCLGALETGTAAFDNVTVDGWSVSWSVGRPVTVATQIEAKAGVSAVELSWSDPDLAARYTVKRGVQPGGPYRPVATDVGPVGFGVRTRFSDATAVSGRRYYYVVAKTNVAGEGPDSAEVAATMPVPPAPVLQSPAEAFGNVGVPFAYLIRASNDPARFTAEGLPDGLRFDPHTGLISGAPEQAGTFDVRIGAGATSGTLRLSVGVAPPDPWAYRDVGDFVLDERQLGLYSVAAIRRAGSTSYDGGKFVLRGAGPDLNVNGQGMTGHYVYQRLSGDHTIIARIAERVNAGTADRVGVIMTKSLSPFDHMAATVVTVAGAGQFLRRAAVAGGAATTAGTGGSWLRLQRAGTTFTASTSTDGVNWTVIGQDTIANFGDAPYYAGLVVCSGSPLVLNRTTFDNVRIG